ncbi:MAG: hypothetical protein Q9186_006748 [Xanthomendoza sp. 1 TL-2023]
MSKSLEKAISSLQAISNGASKFSAAAQEGNRIIPSKTKDASIPVRIDAGRFSATTKKLPVNLQVNSQARTGLADWRKKNTSHTNLATEEFDTGAADAEAEYKRNLVNQKGVTVVF